MHSRTYADRAGLRRVSSGTVSAAWRRGGEAALRVQTDLALRAVTARPVGRRQVPAPAFAVTRAGVRIWLAKSIDARHAREALLLRGVAAVDPAMAGAVIRAPAAIGVSTRGARGQG